MASAESEKTVTDCQHKVQRKLGRCLIRLQQVELLVKALWIDHEHSGYAGEFEAVQAKRKGQVADKTLGTVIKALTGSYLTANLGKPDEEAEDEPEPQLDPTRISFHFKSRISLSEEDYVRTTAELEGLVEMRNALVHHFVESFDLGSESGCRGVEAHLDMCFGTIDAELKVMQGWAKTHLEAKETAASFFLSEEGRRFMVYGIWPDGTVDWGTTPIVAVLREAEMCLAKDGWTSLDAAIKWLSTKYPDKQPAQYGCSRWRHLLHESKLFEIRRVTPDVSVATGVCYRSKQVQS